MSEEKDPLEGVVVQSAQKALQAEPVEAPKKVFTLADIKRSITVSVHLPKLYPEFDPWEFDLRLKLSKEAEDRRQEYLSLSIGEAAVKLQEQALDEICDLLVALPKGFGDLTDNGKGPGSSFREYVNAAGPAQKEFLYVIVEGADNLYWASVMPHEFRRKV